MTLKLGVVMDPIDRIKPRKDSTLAMLLAAQKKGWQLFYFEQADLYTEQGDARGIARQVHVRDDDNEWFALGESVDLALGSFDALLMRKDPPFDDQFLTSTYILEAAQRQGALVVNNPQSLRDCNEKVFATEFPQCCPPVLISASPNQIKRFYAQHNDIILKPLDGMGGASIFRIKPGDANLSVIIETLTRHGSRSIMAQRYIPEIVDGDKRILLINGEPVPYALARVPAVGETRGNLAAGGTGIARPLSDRDRWICEQVGPALKEKKLMFVGIDVIGDYLTEINVTSPTCIRELNAQCNLQIADDLMQAIETECAKRN